MSDGQLIEWAESELGGSNDRLDRDGRGFYAFGSHMG